MWSLFGAFWSVNHLKFCPKLPIWTTHHDFLESRHPEVTHGLYENFFCTQKFLRDSITRI